MSDVYDRLVTLLTSTVGLQKHEIEPDRTFNDLEVDSLALVELTLVAQKEFGVPLSDEELSPWDTIAQAAKIIERKGVKI
jgi:acyl carrier protein